MRRVILLFLTAASLLSAAVPPGNEWMLLLSVPPVVQRFPGRIERTRAASASYRQHLIDVQSIVRGQAEAESVKVIGAVQHLMNGIFVRATAAQAAAPAQQFDTIAPPPPPPADPTQIGLGQTVDQVTAALGQPTKIVKAGAKQIYIYKELKVTFVNGKVSDVE